MELKTKKIIAREFMLFLTCIAIFIIAYFVIFCYNHYNKSAEIRSLNEIRVKVKEIDSLDEKFNEKSTIQNKFTNALNRLGYEYGNFEFWTKLYHNAKTDSIAYKWNNVWPPEFIQYIKNSGYKTPEQFQSFILRNILTKTDLELERKRDAGKAELISLGIKKDDYYKKTLTNSEVLSMAFGVFIVSLILVFGVRPFFFAIKWSINILFKQ